MKKTLLCLGISILSIACKENNIEKKSETKITENQSKVNALLLGTFHFENFNPENNDDILDVKISDVLTDENQKELEKIAKAISEFKPDKIFVEFPHDKQVLLDSIYTNFKETNFSKAKRNEIIQLGFRVAKKLNHKRIYAMDYRTDFPYDSLVNQMKKAKQFHLLKKDSIELEMIEKLENKLFSSKKPLSEIIFHYNNQDVRNSDFNWYFNIANQGGTKDNFVGSYLASEWFRRNLYMYSIIQKTVEKNDTKIMILAGGSHVGVFKDFISKNQEWETTELKEIM